MNKKVKASLIISLFALALIVVLGASDWTAVQADGDGTSPDNPILIETAEDLDNMREGLNLHYRLVAHIDLEDYINDNYATNGWEPIGQNASSQRFTGSFTGGTDSQGNPYTINGLWIDRNDEDNVGLFGSLLNATVENINLSDVDVTGMDHVGGLVGIAENSTIEGIHVSGSVHGDNRVGGLVGDIRHSTTVSQSFADAIVTGENNSIGGLVGYGTTNSVISNSSTASEVAGHWNVGGLVGLMAGNESLITSSYASGNVTGSSYLGGLVGYTNHVHIDLSYATGNVYDGSQHMGGLIGQSNGSTQITRSFATGDITASGVAGGLVGSSRGPLLINESYATGNVSGTGMNIGGLVGVVNNSIDDADQRATITQSYATGNVSSGNGRAGGLTGLTNNVNIINTYTLGEVTTGSGEKGGLIGSYYDNITIESSYWNSTVNSDTGAYNAHGEGKTEAELKQRDTFVDWDFNLVWSLYEGNWREEFPFLKSFNGVTALAVVEVNFITNDPVLVMPGDVLTMHVNSSYENGNIYDATQVVNYSTTDSDVIVVDQDQPNQIVVTGIGEAQIVVEYGGVTETVDVKVGDYHVIVTSGVQTAFLATNVLWIEDTTTYLNTPPGYIEGGQIIASVLDEGTIPEHTDHEVAGDVIDFYISIYHGSPSSDYILTMGYDSDYDANLVDIYYFNEQSEQWEAQNATVDEQAGTLTLEVASFSTYGVFARVEEEDGGDDDGSDDGREEDGDDGDGNDEGGTEEEGTNEDEVEEGTKEDDTSEEGTEETTGNGEELPQTATNMFNILLIGALFMLSGATAFYFYMRKRKLNVTS